MRTVFIDMIIATIVILVFLDFAVSTTNKKRFQLWLFNTWYMLSSMSYRRLLVHMLRQFDNAMDYWFGPKIISLRAMHSVFKLHFLIFGGIFLASLYFNVCNTYVYTTHNDWVILRLAHIETYFAKMQESRDGSTASTYRFWLLKTKLLTPQEFRMASFANATFKDAYLIVASLLVSGTLASVSLCITRALIKSIGRRKLWLNLITDMLLALFLALCAFILIFMIRAGALLGSQIYFALYDIYLHVFELRVDDVRGVFPTLADNVWTMERILTDFGLLFTLGLIALRFVDSMGQVMQFDFAIGMQRTAINWSFFLSMAPTVGHLLLILSAILMKWTYPMVVGKLEKLLAWAHDHPKGPSTAVATLIVSALTLARILLQ